MNIMKYWRWLETGNWIHNTWSELQPITVFRSSVSGLRGPLLNRYWSKLILSCGCVKMFTNEHFLTRLQTIRRHFATSGHPLQTAALRHFSGTTVHYFIQSLFTAENLCCFCVTTCRLRWFYKQRETRPKRKYYKSARNEQKHRLYASQLWGGFQEICIFLLFFLVIWSAI